MIIISNKEKCCGCGACAQSCPVSCISMKPDEEGFLYPSADVSTCVECGRCTQVCPMPEYGDTGRKKQEECFEDTRAFGGFSQNDQVRRESSSGGIFTLFAEAVLSEGGVVYGAGMDPDLKVVHCKAETVEELAPLRKSKYVQSETGNAFTEVREYLRSGRKVLFVGTACQTAGLRSFLGGEDQLLITCDFICHGVPSPLVFRKYLDWLGKKRGSRVTAFEFRNKRVPWNQSGQQKGTIIRYEDGGEECHIPAFRDPFMNAFLSDICLRPSCGACPFKGLPGGYSDLTIADFWGAGKAAPDLCDPLGTSLILVHSEKGLRLMQKVSGEFHGREVETAAAVRRNPCVFRPAEAAAENIRKDFFRRLDTSFELARRKYMTAGYWAVRRGCRLIEDKLGGKTAGKTSRKRKDSGEKNK